jgi:hypothetical protein
MNRALIQLNSRNQDSDQDNDKRHPDGQEFERAPLRSEIELRVKKKLFNECHYMDQMIEEYINLDHINIL